ncbi:MAG: hypothetical protein K2P93_01330, partial [Alphaproteobacteria bacterium]|nr:hypothetical protein [Alphaproteobacteria bacterium]
LEIANLKKAKLTALDGEIAALRTTKMAALDLEISNLRNTKEKDLEIEIGILKKTKLAELEDFIAEKKREALRGIIKQPIVQPTPKPAVIPPTPAPKPPVLVSISCDDYHRLQVAGAKNIKRVETPGVKFYKGKKEITKAKYNDRLKHLKLKDLHTSVPLYTYYRIDQ